MMMIAMLLASYMRFKLKMIDHLSWSLCEYWDDADKGFEKVMEEKADLVDLLLSGKALATFCHFITRSF